VKRTHVAGLIAASAIVGGVFLWRQNSRTPTPARLLSSVGQDANNVAADVIAVRRRLGSLGFSWVSSEKSDVDAELIACLKLVESILAGRHAVSGDGRVDPGARWLVAETNAPVWMKMPLKGEGFVNFERMDLTDQHDYGVHWLAQAITHAGKHYSRYRRKHPRSALLTVNDVSLPRGGNTPDHAGHECGMACDLRLPRLDGQSGGITIDDDAYDRPAARAQLAALWDAGASRALFNDRALIAEGLCRRAKGHDNHIHFEIPPPDAKGKKV